MSSPFRIDVLDSTGSPVAGSTGSLRNVLQVNTEQTLDKIGSLSFIIPANDPKSALITAGTMFDVYTEQENYLGRYIFRKKTISDTDGRASITVQTWDMLKELTTQIAGFGRDYQAENVEDVIEDLLDDVLPAWTLDIGTSLGVSDVTYQGQKYFEAIEELAKRWGYHFRLTSTLRELEFGSFGALNTLVRLTNLAGQDRTFEDRTDVAIIKRISRKLSTEEVYNRAVVLGAGEGASQLQLLDNEVGSTYTVQNRTRTNGQEEFYIEDSASITANGLNEIPLVFDQIRPIANTATARTQAQTELLKNGEIWLERYKDPREQLDNVQVYGLREDILIGQKISVRYKGVDDDGVLYLDIEGDYWVTKKMTTRSARGQYVTSLQLVNVDRADVTDIDVMRTAIRAIKSQRLWITPSAFSQSDTYTETIQHGNGAYTNKNAEFTLTFDDTVTDVTRCVLEFRTKPLTAQAATTWFTGWSTGFGGGASHFHTISQSPGLVFQAVPSDNYPTDIDLYINGTLCNNHADIDYITGGTGRWRNTGTNTELYVKIDITDFVLNAGIYQSFEIEFRPGVARTRDISVPVWSGSTPINSPLGNHGLIEMKILTQGVSQGIYKA